jgi:hypothetical protein
VGRTFAKLQGGFGKQAEGGATFEQFADVVRVFHGGADTGATGATPNPQPEAAADAAAGDGGQAKTRKQGYGRRLGGLGGTDAGVERRGKAKFASRVLLGE